MDFDTVGAVEFGQSLSGLGLNLLVKDVPRSVGFFAAVFEMQAFQPTKHFAILRTGGSVLQLHADSTYHSNPLLQLVPDAGPRGGGAEIRLYDIDPDTAQSRATKIDGVMILQTATNKPHGLREAYILDPDGYCWVPSRCLTQAEIGALEA